MAIWSNNTYDGLEANVSPDVEIDDAPHARLDRFDRTVVSSVKAAQKKKAPEKRGRRTKQQQWQQQQTWAKFYLKKNKKE